MAEEDYYEPIGKALIKMFKDAGFLDITLEITARGKFSNELHEKLKESLSFLSREFSPDLCGHYSSNKIFTVEIKDEELTIPHIYQAKSYAELVKADKAFLISTVWFPLKVIKFLTIRPDILKYSNNTRQLYVGLFDKEKQEIIPAKWLPISPL
jgi:hypothetical protein